MYRFSLDSFEAAKCSTTNWRDYLTLYLFQPKCMFISSPARLVELSLSCYFFDVRLRKITIRTVFGSILHWTLCIYFFRFSFFLFYFCSKKRVELSWRERERKWVSLNRGKMRFVTLFQFRDKFMHKSRFFISNPGLFSLLLPLLWVLFKFFLFQQMFFSVQRRRIEWEAMWVRCVYVWYVQPEVVKWYQLCLVAAQPFPAKTQQFGVLHK